MGAMKRRAKRLAPLSASGIVAINLRKARELRGLSQAEAGERLGRYLRRPWSAASVSAAERSWERPPERSFTANEIDGFSRAFGLPMLWFFLPPGREESGRPLPQRWGRRLLWSNAEDLRGRVEALTRGARAAGLPQALLDAEDALATALRRHRSDSLRRVARQLRKMAGTLETAGRSRRR